MILHRIRAGAIALLLGLVLSFAWLAIGLACILCDLAPHRSISFDTTSISITLIEGRLKDAQFKIDAALGQLGTLIRGLR